MYGSSIAINGTNFYGTPVVKFNGVQATNVVLNSAIKITAIVPAGATTGPVSVTTPAGTGNSPTFTVVPQPVVSNFSPPSGGVGNTVVITGQYFTGATVVKFNATNAVTFTVNSDTQITATVPTGATTGKITVITAAPVQGVSVPSFVIYAAPTISSLGAAGGAVGSSLIINGANFYGAPVVKFNGVASTNVIVNATNKITAMVPAGATTGKITVITNSGTVLRCWYLYGKLSCLWAGRLCLTCPNLILILLKPLIHHNLKTAGSLLHTRKVSHNIARAVAPGVSVFVEFCFDIYFFRDLFAGHHCEGVFF